MISIEDFKKVELTVGEIKSAEKVPETDKLLKLSVDFGLIVPPSGAAPEGGAASDLRQIISGIALHFPDPSVLVGRKCVFVTNLEPRVIRGLQSNGMIAAVSTDLPAGAASAQVGDGKFSLLEVSRDIPSGTKVK